MTTYLLRRLLLMVPTFLGISVVIWLVMALSPGKPTGAGGGGEMGADPAQMDPNKDESERIFREQFALNRPVLWNGWTTLSDEEVLAAVEAVRGGVSGSGIEAFRRARESLTDWGRYAVPPLVRLLGRTEGEVQSAVLGWLRYASLWPRSIYAAGVTPTDEELERDKRRLAENERLKAPGMQWPAGATAAVRAPVVQRWQSWFDEGRAEWDLGAWARVGRGLSDTQFGHYWGNLLRGDLGLSSIERKPVGEMITSRLKYSLSLAVPSFLIAWVLAVLLGVVSATNHGKPLDHGIGVGLFLLYSIPVFATATVLQRILAMELKWFPVSNFDSGAAATQAMTTWQEFKDILWHITLPIVCYTYGGLAYISRQARSGMLEVLKSDYVRTARAKGLPERQVVWRHAVRNGMMPVVTLLGTALPVLLGGSVVIEYIFNIDGFGRLLLNSIYQKDYNVIMGVELAVAALTLVGMLITDILYAVMDPRISYA
ncbi:MAG: ABC transporter permease [Planctomycetia bacterium]